MRDSIRDMLEDMTVEEKEELEAALREDLFLSLREDAEPGACPRCGCAHVVRKGRGPDRSQRWLCRGCGRTFCAKTMSVVGMSKLPASKWERAASLVVARATVSRMQAELGVCRATAWFMRMRILEAMRARLRPFLVDAGSSCQIDGMFLNESLSGNRGPCGRAGAALPRPAHRTGHDAGVRGLSGLKVCVVTGVNDGGDQFAEVGGRGRLKSEEIGRCLEGKALAGAIVSTDSHRSYMRALRAAGAAAHNRYLAAGRSRDELALVDGQHARIRAFLAGFFGVATSNLQSYMDWYCYREQRRRSDASELAVTAADVANGRYRTTRRGYRNRPIAFGEYWDAA